MKVSAKLKLLGDRIGDPALEGISQGIHAVTRTFSGKLLAADGYYQRAELFFDCQPENEPTSCSGQHPCFIVKSIHAINDLIRFDNLEAHLSQRAALDRARKTGNPYTIAECLMYSAIHAQIRADSGALRKFAAEGRSLSSNNGFEGLASAFNILWAVSDIVLYRNIKAFDTLCQNLARYREKFALLHYPYYVWLLAKCCLHMNQYEQTLTQSNQALLLIDRYGEKWIKPAVLLCRAEAAVRCTQIEADTVSRWFDEAEKCATEQHAALFINAISQSRRASEREQFRQNMLVSTVYEPEPGVIDFELFDLTDDFSLTDHSIPSTEV